MSQGPMAVVLFVNTQAAIRAEQALQAEGIASKLIPVPRELSSECGMALRIPGSEGERVRALLESRRIPFGAIRELAGG